MGLRIGIIGSGAVGTYYGAKLAHAGSDVHFLVRGDLTEVLYGLLTTMDAHRQSR